jgi:hypothetical protein
MYFPSAFRAKFGVLAEGKKRWCSPRGKKRDGVVFLGMHKMCEDCGAKRANFGVPAEGKKRWCSP